MADTVKTTEQEMYEEQKKQLEASKKQAEYTQGVTLERLKKYLPEMARANGKLAPSDSDVARVFANYAGNMSNIEKDYAEQQSDLLNRYYAGRKEEEDAAYNTALGRIGNWEMDNDSLQNYLNSVKGSVSDQQYTDLEALADHYKNDALTQQNIYENEKARSDLYERKAKEADDVKTSGVFTYYNGVGGLDKVGNNFTLRDKDGEKYKVESGGIVDGTSGDGYYVVEKAKKLDDGAVFEYGNKVYIKKDGNVYLIQGRYSSNTGYSKLFSKFGK